MCFSQQTEDFPTHLTDASPVKKPVLWIKKFIREPGLNLHTGAEK
jgi:hypothetical protein